MITEPVWKQEVNLEVGALFIKLFCWRLFVSQGPMSFEDFPLPGSLFKVF